MKRVLSLFVVWWSARRSDRHRRPGPGHRANHRHRQGFERRRPSGGERHRHPDRYRVQARGRDRCGRPVLVSRHSGRPLPARSDAAGFPHLRADRHRAAGQQQPDRAGHAGARRSRRNDHRPGERAGGRNAKPRRRPGDGQQAHPRPAVERAEPGRPPAVSAGVGAAGAGPRQQRHGRQRRRTGVLAGRRAGVRRDVRARRRDAQRPTEQPEPPAAVPGCAAGVPGGNQRPDGAERDAFGRGRQRGDQVGHERRSAATSSSSSAITVSTRPIRSGRRTPTARAKTTG